MEKTKRGNVLMVKKELVQLKGEDTKVHMREVLEAMIGIARKAKYRANTLGYMVPKRYRDERNPNLLVLLFLKIDVVTARALVSKFETIAEMMMAGEDELMEVHGVGKGIARKIKSLGTLDYIPTRYADG